MGRVLVFQFLCLQNLLGFAGDLGQGLEPALASPGRPVRKCQRARYFKRVNKTGQTARHSFPALALGFCFAGCSTGS